MAARPDGGGGGAAAGEAWRLLLIAQARLTARLEADAAAAGVVPVAWFDLLTTLDSAPGRRVRLCDLAEAVLLTRAGLSRLVDRVEAAGLLRREPCPDDRRGAFAAMTPAGTAAVRRAWPVYRRTIDRQFAGPLTPNAAAGLVTGLRAVLNANGWLPEARTVELTVRSKPPRTPSRPADGRQATRRRPPKGEGPADRAMSR